MKLFDNPESIFQLAGNVLLNVLVVLFVVFLIARVAGWSIASQLAWVYFSGVLAFCVLAILDVLRLLTSR